MTLRLNRCTAGELGELSERHGHYRRRTRFSRSSVRISRLRCPKSLLQMADEALYCAKQKGRNRAELATPPDDTALAPDQQLSVANDAIKAESL
jgi:hypothetical protein